MSGLRKAAQQALEALDGVLDTYGEPLDLMTISGGTYEALECRDAITALRAALAQPDEKFCDANCVWTDHHPGCALAQLEWDEVFDAAVYSWKARTPGRDALRLCFQDKSDDSEIFTHWTSRELMDFAERIATLYTAIPQRKPLTDEQIDAIVRSNVTITDQNLAGAVYMAMRELEAAHGIEERQ